MQKIIKWFAPIVAIGVAVFIVFFLVSINSTAQVKRPKPLVYETEIKQSQLPKVWLNQLSKTKQKGYFYPVREIYINVKLQEKVANFTKYKLFANIKDPYSFFCFKEELERFGFKYYLKKDTKAVELIIYSTDLDKLNSLVEVLKKYKILATVEPIKED